jgi:peptidyl-prolyl cis-trans isomerase C
VIGAVVAAAVLAGSFSTGMVRAQQPNPPAPAPKSPAQAPKPAATSPKVAAPAPKPGPRPSGADVVARVNGAPILRRDFDLAVQVEFRRRGPGERRHEDLKAVRDGVLDVMIDNELLYQKAAKTGVTVTEAETRDEVVKLKAMLGSEEDAAAFMKEAGLTEKDLADQVRRSIVVRRFVDAEVAPGVAVSDAQARSWYDAHPEAVTRPEAVRISQIVVRVPQGASAAARATAREKIEAVMKELRAGKDFGEMARLHSEGPEAKRNGDSGWVWSGGGALPQVERAALALKPGETSDIIESRRGFHIIKATDRRPAGPAPFEETRERIIANLKDEQRAVHLKEYVAGLRKTAHIEKLA